MSDKLFGFIGSLVVILIALGIFLILMTNNIPDKNREAILIFVSSLFTAIATSVKNISGHVEKDKKDDKNS
jgi:hypothetical protein